MSDPIDFDWAAVLAAAEAFRQSPEGRAQAKKFLDSLPDAELSFGPMTRLATDGDFMLDEMGIRPEGYESGN
jgi:hypothetical protein